MAKVNDLLDQIDDNYEYDDASEDKDREVNIFGQGLADRITRLPGFEDQENIQKNFEDNRGKFQCSYLSSIQSIRTIEKDKLNKALHDRMNRLAIMDRNFKIMMNKRYLSQPRAENLNLISNRTDNEENTKEPIVMNKIIKSKKQVDKNLVKFWLTKNADFLFANSAKVQSNKIDVKMDKSLNMNVDIPVNTDDSGSDFLKELDPAYEDSNKSTPRNEGVAALPGSINENKIDEEENNENDTTPAKSLIENEVVNIRNISSNENVKPAKVVFKKSSQSISRAERANKMAHFEYMESGLSNTQDDIKYKNDRKVKMNSRLYTMVNKKNTARNVNYTNEKMNEIYIAQPPQTNKFSPKRFRRFPRFTIFLNKDHENSYEKENSISLNPQFLNFLMTPERAEMVDKGNY